MTDSWLLLVVQAISRWSIPVLLVSIPVYAYCRGVRVYEVFVEGAREGALTAARILPYLVTMWVAIALLRSSGALDLLLLAVRPVFSRLGVPVEVLPLVVMRPLSGSGSISIVSELMQAHGPDSPVGLLASIMLGSTETTFYVVTVYLGAVGVRKARHGLTAALIGDVAGFIGAVAAWRLFCG